ncbi:MAG: methylated-DNA--[protein]-cysteine S-methyltransferase [Clostridiales bacterium]|nr:methylated-DNA--[protein]-cysteine S-methyltransferase [Clostridiales bacterium]
MGKVYLDSRIGVWEIITDSGFLTKINLVDRAREELNDDVGIEVKRQLSAYFDGKLKVFDLPIKLNGQGFCLKVWESMRTIPYGKTVTYGDLASMAGSPKAYRSAGSCAGKNPIPIIVPCHRVVASIGLGGFGLGLDVKRYLLALEQAYLV